MMLSILEIVGGGIEFDWAMAKLWYQKLSVERKRNKYHFIDSVKRALSNEVIPNEGRDTFPGKHGLTWLGITGSQKIRRQQLLLTCRSSSKSTNLTLIWPMTGMGTSQTR